MDRFPHDEVARNARAETLRDLGRYEEALAAFEATMERFPHNEVARNACGHLLAQLGRFSEAEALLATIAGRPRTRNEWIARHILAMARLRAGDAQGALVELDVGLQSCSFRDVRRYFESARALALLVDRRPSEAAGQLETLLKREPLPLNKVIDFTLFRAHALAEAGEPNVAETLIGSATILDFTAERQRRLAAALSERYGLGTGLLAVGKRTEQLAREIDSLEFMLVRPPITDIRARISRAA